MKFLQFNYIKYGLIMSSVLVICLLIMHITGHYSSFQTGTVLDAIFVLAPFVVWLFGLLAYRKELKNNMTFKQGWSEGIRISLVFGAVSPFIFMIYYVFFNPGVLSYVRDTYGLNGASNTTVIIVDMLAQAIGSIVMGTVYTAILAFFLKSTKS